MLIVFHRAPRTTPSETMLEEQSVEQVAPDNAIGRGTGTIGIGCSRSRLHVERTVRATAHAGIIKCVDIDCHTSRVFGEMALSCYFPIAETGAVVVAHRTLIVRIITIDESDFLDGIALTIELAENIEQVGCN